MPLQLSQDDISNLLFHTMLPLTQGSESAPPVPELKLRQPLMLAQPGGFYAEPAGSSGAHANSMAADPESGNPAHV